ncbi:MAG: retroviral-like aspartic protease family protein [Gammaproteobacteria bacterium]|nr:retroviral-like aspartic protease family protein [Gammaproteobacteria bacterium]
MGRYGRLDRCATGLHEYATRLPTWRSRRRGCADASDRVAAKLGVLKSVRLGEISVNDVKVTFISDDRLGNTMLLGMSFLERFNVTIDDAHNALILLI